MRSFVLTVRPAHSAFALGGQTSPGAGADKATARDDRGRLVIPASALRGALRIELERLLRGRDGEGAACGANRAATADLDRPCGCPVCRLFGEEAGATGTLRLEDALWAGADDEPATTVAVRPHVGVSRKTGTVVEKLLGFVETGDLLGEDREEHLFRASARLVPLGPGDEPRLAEDETYLRAACAALNALGGGKARGLGWVECSLAPVPTPRPAVSEAPARSAALAEAAACELRFTAEAPLHLGQGRPIGYFQPTLRHAPGSTVRGALAFALLEAGLCGADDPGFRRLAAGGGASFGTARLQGEVPSETRRRCRPGGHVFDDLVGELVRRAAARRGMALGARPGHVCLQPGCASTKLLAAPRRPGTREPVVRVRTRTALNRQTGTAMDRKLYSLEVLEPRLADRSGADPLPLTLVATVRGLDPASAGLLAALDGREVWLGGKRSKGMGRCRLDLRPERGPDEAAVRAAVESLHEALKEAWGGIAAVAGTGLSAPGTFLPPEQRPFAIVLEEPWAPEEAGADPCPELALGPLGVPEPAGPGLRPLDGFVALTSEGSFGAVESRRYGAPAGLAGERPPQLAAAAGSVYVYAVDALVLEARLPGWLETGRLGTGRNRDLGWGRFRVRGADLDF